MEQIEKQNNLPRVLFVEDKWCGSRSRWGVSEWETNLFLSLKEIGIAEVDVFHFDEYFKINKKRGDEALLEKIKEWKPDFIFMVIYRLPGTHPAVIDFPTLEIIKNIFKIPIASIWGDLHLQGQKDLLITLLPYIKRNFATASDDVVKKINEDLEDAEKIFYIWVPKNPKIFNDPGKIRDIEISYFGSPTRPRLEKINYLLENNIPITCGGGERQEHLTTEQYADKFKSSKITLSFSKPNDTYVINARPFEAMACGAMVMEQENPETSKLFVPNVEYVPYSDNNDLLKKIKYYLEHDEKRKEIAKNGWKKVTTVYSAERFWKFVINATLKKDGILPNPITAYDKAFE
jgi:hypothetical protein